MMKKFIITLTLLFLVFFCFSQGVIVRTTGTQTVEDMRLMAGLNFYVPVYPDTTTANLTANKGIDSAGALIFCRDINGFRIRRSNPKRWDYVTDSAVFSTITALKDSAAVLRALITSSTVGAGGNNTDIQFNNHGAFGGDDNLQYDGTNLLVGVSKNVALKKGDYLYFNGVDTTWKIQLITTSGSDHIITGNELRLSIPTTSEGFSINNGAGVPSFQVQGNTGLAYIKGDLQIGAYQLPNTDGINGQALITNGTGNAAWTTIPATGITALTGDVTASGTGSVATTLATVNSTPNTFGDSTKTLVVTVNGKGLVTSVVSKSILISQSQILNPNITGLIAGGTNIALSGSGTSGSPYVINSTAPGTGTVTSITAGAALTGGTITTSGTIGADTSVLATKTALIDSLANYVKAPIPNSSLQHSAVFLVPSEGITVGSSGILTLGNTVSIGIDTTGTIATTTALKDTAAAIRSSIGSGSVTSIATTSGILGGTITSTGTLKADTSLLATKSYVNQQDTTINAGIDLTQTYSGAIKSLNADTTTGNTKLATQGYVLRNSGGGGSGTVTSVSVTTVNGVSGTVATSTTTPAISLTLGNITPTTVSTNAVNYLPQTSTLTVAHGNTIYDSSGLVIKDSLNKELRISRTLQAANTLITDSIQGTSGQIALLSNVAAKQNSLNLVVPTINGASTLKRGTSVDTLNIPNYYPYTSLGTILNQTSYSSLTGYLDSGSVSPTFSGGAMILTNGSATYSKTICLNSTNYAFSGLWNWTVTEKITPTGTSTGGFLGIRSSNYTYSADGYAQIDLSGTGTSGTLSIVANTGLGDAVVVSSATKLTFATNDNLILTYQRNGAVFTATVRDQTTNTAAISISYAYDMSASSNSRLPNTGHFSFGSIATTPNLKVDSLNITSTTPVYSDVCFIGDSKSAGYDASILTNSYDAMLARYFRSYEFEAGSGDKSVDVVNKLPELLALQAQTYFLNIGRNDSLVDSAVTKTNIINIVSTLQAAGRNVIILLPFYETNVNQQWLVNFYIRQFSASIIIDTYTPTEASGLLNADGIHPNDAGHLVIFNTIIVNSLITPNVMPITPTNNNAVIPSGYLAQSIGGNNNLTYIANNTPFVSTHDLGFGTSTPFAFNTANAINVRGASYGQITVGQTGQNYGAFYCGLTSASLFYESYTNAGSTIAAGIAMFQSGRTGFGSVTDDNANAVQITGALGMHGSVSGIVKIIAQGQTGSYTDSLPNSIGTSGYIRTTDGVNKESFTNPATIQTKLAYSHTIFTPTTGGTVALVNNQYNIINPAGALLALTVNLPSSPANNDVVYIKFTQNVTTVTYGNGTVVDGITAPTAGGLTVLTFDSGTTSWY